jgi:hypothetical protein
MSKDFDCNVDEYVVLHLVQVIDCFLPQGFKEFGPEVSKSQNLSSS